MRSPLSLQAALRAVRKRWRQWTSWWRVLGRLGPYIRRSRGRLLLAAGCGLTYTAVGLLEPWPLKLILDCVILDHPLPWSAAPFDAASGLGSLALLNILIVSIVLIAVSNGLLYYIQKLLTARVGQQVTAELRLALYSHLQRLSFNFHDRRRTGDLLNRLTVDIRLLRDIFIQMPLAVTTELFLMVGMLTVMLLMDWTLTLMALIVLPGLALILRTYQGPMRQAIRRQRDREGDIASIAAEVLGAIKVVQGFRREEHEIQRFSVQNKRSLRTGLKAARLEAKLRWYAEIAVAVVTALVVAVAARRVLAGALSPGDLIVFVSYLRTFNRPLRRVSRMAERAARGAVAGERVLEMLAVEPAVQNLPGAVAAPDFAGAIRFEQVGFCYRRGQPALIDVSLDIPAGQRVAVVGPTGAGKSTLISLIPRFHDPTSGRVRIDGRDLREFTLASLRDRIALVFQEPILFATTIAENIGYGCAGATRDRIVAAAQQAGIDPIIRDLPEGYDTVLGERGGTLSGGQRQCVAIARAIIKDAPVVLLDEPTASLDRRSAGMVLDALRQLMAGRTVIVISHQLLTVRDVDRIVVIDGGRILDQGTHAELLQRQGLYQHLHWLQAGDVSA